MPVYDPRTKKNTAHLCNDGIFRCIVILTCNMFIARLRKTGDAAGHKIGTWKRYVQRLWVGTCVTVFVGQEMVNFPAPQKPDPKISPHGTHTVYDSVCGAGNGQFSCPTKTRPQDITPWYSHYLWQCLWGRKWSIFLPHKNPTPSPKSSQNRGIFDVYAKPKTTSVAKTPLFATLSIVD